MRYLVIKLVALFTVCTFSFAAGQSQDMSRLPSEVYSTPGPHVVVNGALLKAPVQRVQGSLLLPMRAVFEALQAEVRWFPAAQQITATRGAVTVQLWINRGVAIVNDREIPLAVPPTLLAGSTYVPLRFPAEAFGGDVKWLSALQAAVITITPLSALAPEPAPAPALIPTPTPAPAPIPTPPAPAASTAPTEITGVLLGKNTEVGRALLYQKGDGGDLALAQLTAETVIQRGKPDAAPAPAAFADLQPGDLLILKRDTAGKLLAVTATYAEAAGKVAGFANNKLLLQDGGLYQLSPQVRAQDTQGKAVALAEIAAGKEVTLQVTPESNTVWLITVPAAATPPPALSAPKIVSVGPVNYGKPLKAGDVLTLQVMGTPGAAAVTARVGAVLTNVPLTEQEPGRYLGSVTIGPNTNAAEVPIFAVLRANAMQTAEMRSALTVTIDTTPPRFDALNPGQDAQLFDRSPTLVAAFSDPGGSGIDPEGVAIALNGTEVTENAIVTAQGLSYRAVNLPLGMAQWRVSIADRAGNVTVAEWKVNIAAATQPAYITALTHDATAPLLPGQSVKLTAKLAVAPARLEWYLGQQLISTAAVLDPVSKAYTIAYQVKPDDAVGENRVSLRCFIDDTRNQVVFAEKPVTIAALPAKFTVTAPADKSKAPAVITVTGTAAAQSRVRVTINYTSMLIIVALQGEVARATVTAGDDGAWTTQPIDITVPLTKPDTYTVKVELLDKEEAAVETITLTLTAK
jgi:hypothetical protein